MLFKNDRRERDDQPYYTGFATVDGKEYFVSAYLDNRKTLPSGAPNPKYNPAKKPRISMIFSPREPRHKGGAPAKRTVTSRPPPPPPK